MLGISLNLAFFAYFLHSRKLNEVQGSQNAAMLGGKLSFAGGGGGGGAWALSLICLHWVTLLNYK